MRPTKLFKLLRYYFGDPDKAEIAQFMAQAVGRLDAARDSLKTVQAQFKNDISVSTQPIARQEKPSPPP